LDDVADGLQRGVKKGIKTGVTEGTKPIAEEAGKKAIEMIMKGQTQSEINETIKNISAITQLKALENYLSTLQKDQTPPPTQQPQQKQTSIFEELLKLGIKPETLIEQYGIEGVIALTKPELAPLLTSIKRPKSNDGDGSNQLISILPLLLQTYKQPEPQYTPPPSQQQNNSIELFKIILEMQKQQQDLQRQLLEKQQQELQERLSELAESIQYSRQPQKSLKDQLQEIQETAQILGLGTRQRPPSPLEIELEKTKIEKSLDLKEKEMEYDREEKLKMKELEHQKELMAQATQLVQVFSNIMKNINLQIPTESDSKSPSNEVKNIPPLAKHISNKITSMLKKSSETEEDEEERDDDDE